jgi:maltooligosyltrehalose trehalohydrolase
MLFQGEEFAASSPFQYFTSHEDPDIGRAVTEGRRREFSSFGWNPEDVPNPQDSETFERSKLNWDELDKEPHRSILDWYRRLIRLRHSSPEVIDGNLDLVEVQANEETGFLTMRRGSVEIVCNFSSNALEWKAPGGATLLLASTGETAMPESGLAPESVLIFQHKR